MSKNFKRRLATAPLLGPWIRLGARLWVAWAYARPKCLALGKWLVESQETTNFTYRITPLSRAYLLEMLACVTHRSDGEIEVYAKELEGDHQLQEHIREATSASRKKTISDATMYVGKRLGWYVLVRALKPKVVVETGIDKGLGACVLCAALLRNAREGHPGRYYGLDINPEAGFLLSGPYRQTGEIVLGDSAVTIPRLPSPIDIFINDSDHSAAHEELEYRLVRELLSDRAVIIGDNAHGNDRLLKFSKQAGRKFVFWGEKPEGHWYPGGGIGLSYPD